MFVIWVKVWFICVNELKAVCLKTWHRHRCLTELKVTHHYWVLSKTKLFYGQIILLFLILFYLFLKWKLFMSYLYYGGLNIGNQSWHVLSSVRIFFKRLDLAHKWINCCNKSISVGVFTGGIVCIIYFNCFVVYLALLSMFLFPWQCLVMSSCPLKFET